MSAIDEFGKMLIDEVLKDPSMPPQAPALIAASFAVAKDLFTSLERQAIALERIATALEKSRDPIRDVQPHLPDLPGGW